ncbi:MAG: hypothetical protein COA79_14410 [Planctomycetota bacterium]|nr:MAG: hypothetical protein COA79_14410 [Planctomycetota bacterium]
MISQHEIDTFVERGAVLLDGILEPELIDAASEEMDRQYDAHENNDIGIIQYVFGDSLEEIYQHPHLEAIAKKVIGTNEVDFIASAFLHTLPNSAEKWGYKPETEHVDIQYNEEEWCQTPRRILIMFMIFLDDVTSERAPTVVRLGSQLSIAKHHGTKDAYKDRPQYIIDLPKLNYEAMTPLTGKKGQVAVSTTSLIHTGSFNTTEKARKMFFVSYAATGSNINFNTNLAQERLDYMNELHRRFSPERKHLVEGTIKQLEGILLAENNL